VAVAVLRAQLWTIREFTGWSIRESDTPPW
jgi:hypothetical protein